MIIRSGRRSERRGWGTDFSLRQPHELSGDLDLAFDVIGQPLGRDNRFLQDWRFDPGHAPVSALG
jgi:hypothetical protein